MANRDRKTGGRTLLASLDPSADQNGDRRHDGVNLGVVALLVDDGYSARKASTGSTAEVRRDGR
jgi:hypothetical protein